MLPLVNDKVRRYGHPSLRHNHGPGDDVYTTPDLAYARIRFLDKRIGLCRDVGHTVRVGKDSAALSEQCARVPLDVHIEDVTAATAKGCFTPCGRGVIDLPRLLRTFIKIGYAGFLALNTSNSQMTRCPAWPESVGYIRSTVGACSRW